MFLLQDGAQPLRAAGHERQRAALPRRHKPPQAARLFHGGHHDLRQTRPPAYDRGLPAPFHRLRREGAGCQASVTAML